MGRYLSSGASYVAGMTQTESATINTTVVAVFGTGELVQTAKGRLALRGGTPNDYTEAKEWVSMFMPEATVQRPS